MDRTADPDPQVPPRTPTEAARDHAEEIQKRQRKAEIDARKR